MNTKTNNLTYLIQLWLVNALVFNLLWWTLLQFIVAKVVPYAPIGGTAYIKFLTAEVYIGLVLTLVLISLIVATFAHKFLHLKHYLLIGFVPQIVIGILAWLSTYNLWTLPNSRLFAALVYSTILLIALFILGLVKNYEIT